MHVPVESRLLLNAAEALVPPAERSDWRREWDAEIWWWLSSHTGERLQLALHCAGAITDAIYLRASQLDTAPLRRALGTPSACLAILVVLLAAVITGSGLRETRRALHGEPFPSDRLAVLSQVLPFMGAHFGVPPSKVADWNAHAQSLEGAAYYASTRHPGTVQADPHFFSLLGVRPMLGSLDQPGLVLSYEYWQRAFHGNQSVVGRSVAGVLPPGFWFLDLRPDIWILGLPANDAPAGAVARLKPGVSAAAAQAELRDLVGRVKSNARGSAVIVEPIAPIARRPVAALGIPWLVLLCAAAAGAFIRFPDSRRFAAFLAAKCALALTLVLVATVEFGASWMTIHSGTTNLAAGVASLWLFLAGPGAVLWWCWLDQQRRCRTCLRRLAMPVTFGSGARILLERAGTELVCPYGHGTLLTTEGADPSAQWDPMDSSWQELFVK